jgi:glycosyltransferase involved in cell wall biosynthesis
MTAAMAARARQEMRANQRYEWLGELPRSHVRRILAKSRLSVVPSRIEGGANVVSEAITASVPVLASRIDGNVGILGTDYPGLFNVGDTQQLARLLARAETDRKYLAELRDSCNKLAPLFDPRREEKAWANLISELFPIESA